MLFDKILKKRAKILITKNLSKIYYIVQNQIK